ncbi:MAG: hypothetical protein WCK51_09835 [Armatimonadota bacterium]
MAPELLTAEFDGYSCVISGTRHQGILSPLSRAISQGIDVVGLLEENPAEGDRVLAELVSQCSHEMRQVSGPLNYIVAGAEPDVTSPMQYGGHFLELDRELIGTSSPAITLIGGPETYIDVVSDIAKSYLIWNPETNPVDPHEVSRMTTATPITSVNFFPYLNAGSVN